MKSQFRTVLISVAGSLFYGLVFWVLDSLTDYLHLKESFVDLLILDIPGYELYIRITVLIFFIAFGIIKGILISKNAVINESLRKSHEELVALNEELVASQEEITAQNEELAAQTAALEETNTEIENQKIFFEQNFIQSSTIMIILDSKGCCMQVNPRYEEAFGISSRDLLNNKRNIFRDEFLRNTINKRKLANVYEKHMTVEGNLLCGLKTKKAKKRWYHFKAYPVYSKAKELTNVVIQYEDITGTKLKEQQLSSQKERYKVTLESIGDAVITTDLNGNIVMVNRMAEKLTGWTYEESLGMPVKDVFNVVKSKPENNSLEQVLGTGKIINREKKHVLISKNGTKSTVSTSIAPIKDNSGRVMGVVFVFRDITREEKQQERILFLSYHDKLTGLHNRTYFETKLEQMDKAGLYPLSIIIGDVNGLKLTNDVFGHLEGDKLLKTISVIIKDNCSDEFVTARWGGDEFAVIMPSTGYKKAVSVCQDIKKACNGCKNSPIPPSIALGAATKTDSSSGIYTILKEAEDNMYKTKLLESKSARSSIISSLEKTLIERSYETEEHAHRLKELSEKMGEALSLSQNEKAELNLLSILHDIGKIGIPDNILLKPGKLNAAEWIEMKKHCEIGFRIAQASYELTHLAEFILCHHERWDGKGYPQGLKETEIPLLSRILAILDSYDAMTHKRPYRKPVSHAEAIKEIKKCSGSQFDPHIADVFINLWNLP